MRHGFESEIFSLAQGYFSMTGGFKLKRNDLNISQLKIHAIGVGVWQKPKQCCKAIILQLKINNFKNMYAIESSLCFVLPLAGTITSLLSEDFAG